MICSGNLLEPLGDGFANALIEVIVTANSQATGGQLIQGVSSQHTTDVEGNYSFELNEGFYQFDAVSAAGVRVTIGVATVVLDTIDSNMLTLIGSVADLPLPLLGYLTPTSTDTVTNKTLNDSSNFIHADATHLYVKAKTAITKGQPVMFDGYNIGEDAIDVIPCNANLGVTIGLAEIAIAQGSFGMIVTQGNVTKIDTSLYTPGEILYPDGTGGLTNTPTTTYKQRVAFVLKVNANNGALLVNAHSPIDRAFEVGYDNTTSGLTATNVQDAIDELKTLIP